MAASQDQQTSASQDQQGGDWWVEEISIGKGAITRIVQAATAPQATGDVLNVFGPYPTQAAAQAASKNGTPTGKPHGSQSGLVPTPANPLAGLVEVGHWIGELVTHLTDIYMWRSLGWLALGLVLLVIGVLLLLRKEDLIPNAVPVPVPV